MEWVQSLFNGESGTAVQLILMVLVIAIVLMLIVWIFRRIAGTPARKAARNRVPRLSITDVTAVDDKRFLVLARRDNVEHLLLIGGNGDVVVETGIIRAQPAQQPVASQNLASAAAKSSAVNSIDDVKTNDDNIIAPTIAAASTAAVGAVGASITGTSASALEKTAEVVSDVSDTIVETASSTTEAIVDVVTPAKTKAIETSAEISTPDVSLADGNSDTAPPMDEPALELGNLEAELSEQLDDALSLDDLGVAVETPKASSGSGDDEMQKLLDELAKETKTPA